MLTNWPPSQQWGSLCRIQLRVDERSSAGYWASHPQGLHNPIFWALILLHCLEASQTHTHASYSTIMVNTIHLSPSSILPLRLRQPNRLCYHPLVILKKLQGVGFLQLPGNIKSMKCCSLKCQFDIKGSCWETREWGYNIAFDEQGCYVCLRYNGL